MSNSDSGVLGSGDITFHNNVISVNGRDGFAVERAGGSTFTLNVVTTNEGNGIRVAGLDAVEPILIGGAGNENVMLNNGASGIFLDAGDVAGVGGSLLPPQRVTISRNRTAENGGIGIDIFPDGLTVNDAGDADGGPNGTLNFPVLESADADEVRGTACGGCLVEVFLADDSKASNHGEAAFFIGDAHADETGAVTVPLCRVVPGDEITATATDTEGNTSELSENLIVTIAAAACPTPVPTPTPGLPTPTPTPTPDLAPMQGDVQCDVDVDTVDALQGLRHVAALPVFQEEDCQEIGAAGAQFGDVDCDNDVDSVDSLKILRHVAALPVTQTEPCTDIGDTPT